MTASLELEHTGIHPDDLATCLRVLGQLDDLPVEHPHAVAIREAVGGVFKQVKMRRRRERREARVAADEAVTAATATGAPDRIDDETQGLPLASRASGVVAGELINARACYICKTRYTVVDAFYHQLCPECAAFSHDRREARTDLTGRRALLTGGRAKIGMHIALRLLRDGAHTTITTRFPNDAVRRFSSLPDSADWLHRLRIIGLDLRDPAQVIALAEDVASQGPLDILINNAAQTVRRTPQAYALLAAAEAEAAALGPGAPEVVTYARGTDSPTPEIRRPQRVSASDKGTPTPEMRDAQGLVSASDKGAPTPELGDAARLVGAPDDGAPTPEMGRPQGVSASDEGAPTPESISALALTAGSASPARIAAQTAIDAGGLVPDLQASNSWVQTVDEVDPVELLEVQLCNSTAPFILISRLRPQLAAAARAHRRSYVVNVSAMEGQFARGYKGAGHPHTNMAKAALNMLTRTSAAEMLTDGILMTAVDTGWITDERPHPTKMRLADAGFHAPLDLVDGAARVYDPIVRGEAGEDLHGVFLKDYRPAAW